MKAAIRPLLPLPDVDELLLTAAELAKLTGTTQSRLQIIWLTDNDWDFFLSRAGHPVVGRLYANLKLSGLQLSALLAESPFQLKMSAING